ncbi:ABC transporter substrate-binding protein [Jannaschia sp. 2305UL9-9]|uniref:ABC transporter substrate-binding protein n=1 Tax=Jannaschia sp. 2305UL9-9 TaxID=3121638 RepID=UPI0035299085
MKSLLTATALLTIGAAPAMAQNAICGGISIVGEWVGGSQEDSDILMAGAAIDANGQIPIAGHLVRMFTLSGPTDLRIEVAAQPAGDPYISVYDAAGTEVAADDDSGGDFASRVETTLDAGTYCLAARSYESGVTDVAVRIGRTSHEALLGNSPAQQANIIAAADGTLVQPSGTGGTCGTDSVARLGDDLSIGQLDGGLYADGPVSGVPGWAFSLAEATPLTVTAESAEGDPLIRLLDAAGNQLAENDDANGLDSQIDMTGALAPGEYCVEMEDLNGTENIIRVGITTFDPAADRLRRLNAAELAPTPADVIPVTDLGAVSTSAVLDINATGDAQWLRFDLPSGGLVVSEAIGTTGADPVIVLFDRVGRRVAENDDGPVGLDSYMATRLLPGSYQLAVRLVSADDRGPVRVLLERYVPAQ